MPKQSTTEVRRQLLFITTLAVLWTQLTIIAIPSSCRSCKVGLWPLSDALTIYAQVIMWKPSSFKADRKVWLGVDFEFGNYSSCLYIFFELLAHGCLVHLLIARPFEIWVECYRCKPFNFSPSLEHVTFLDHRLSVIVQKLRPLVTFSHTIPSRSNSMTCIVSPTRY